jgi:hypothetical protein
MLTYSGHIWERGGQMMSVAGGAPSAWAPMMQGCAAPVGGSRGGMMMGDEGMGMGGGRKQLP